MEVHTAPVFVGMLLLIAPFAEEILFKSVIAMSYWSPKGKWRITTPMFGDFIMLLPQIKSRKAQFVT